MASISQAVICRSYCFLHLQLCYQELVSCISVVRWNLLWGTHLFLYKHRCSNKTIHYLRSLRLWAAHSGPPWGLSLSLLSCDPTHKASAVFGWGTSGQGSASCWSKVTHRSSAGQQLLVLGYRHDNSCSITTRRWRDLWGFVATPLLYHWLPQSASLMKIHFGNNFLEIWNDSRESSTWRIRSPFSFKLLIERVRPVWRELCLAAVTQMLTIHFHLLLGSITLFFLALTPEGASEFLISLSPGRGLSSVV